MNNNDLPKGYMPLDGEKKRRQYWKYMVTLFIFLVVGNAVRIIKNDKESKEARDILNRQAPSIASAIEGLSPQELEHMQNVRDRADEICRKYLTPDEYAQSTSSGLKIGQGIATTDDINRTNFSWEKVMSLASPAEKKTLNEFSRLTQKLAGMQK